MERGAKIELVGLQDESKNEGGIWNYGAFNGWGQD